MTETLAYGYSSERTQWEPHNAYQHDRISIVYKKLCIFVRWTKVARALEGLRKHMVWHRRTRAGLRAAASPALSWLQISAASVDLTQTFITSSALGFPGSRFMYDPRRRLCCEEYSCLHLLSCAQCLLFSLTSGARAGKTRGTSTHTSVWEQ